MIIDIDTEIRVHLKVIDHALEEIDSNTEDSKFSHDMREALTELQRAKDAFQEAFTEARRLRNNV
jgi:hypothetical protein